MTAAIPGMSGWELILPFLEPLAALLVDETITEIMVNPDGRVFVERDGLIGWQADVHFAPGELEPAVERIAIRLGQQVDAEHPLFEGRLPDGSRVAAIFPPCSVGGITFTIRKFQHKRFTPEEFIRTGSVPAWAMEVLRRAILERQNILISGGTGTGKTTFLNVLAQLIPPGDRIIVLEDVHEVQIAGCPHAIYLEARRETEGITGIAMAELLRATLRHRPDRIVVGEVRGAEAYDLLQALNTGHSGSISTLQADSAEQAAARLTTCVVLRNAGLSHTYIRAWIADAIHWIAHLERRDGRRYLRELLRLEGYDRANDRYRFCSITEETAHA